MILENVIEELFGEGFKSVFLIETDNWQNRAISEMKDLGGDKHLVVLYELDNSNKPFVKNFYVFIKYLCIHGDQVFDLLFERMNDFGFDLSFEYKDKCLEPGNVCKAYLREREGHKKFRFAYPTKATLEGALLDTFWNVMHTFHYYELKRAMQ